MNKFRNEEGLTLIELLITLAVIAIVFAIAVPVFSNVLAGAQTSADSAQAAALASFHDEYATTDLAFANGKTTATLNGVVIASIKGDATSGSTGGGSTPVVSEYVFDTASSTLWAYAGVYDSATSPVWTPETPVLKIQEFMGTSTYYYYTVARSQENMLSFGTPSVLAGNVSQLDAGMMGGITTFRNLSAAPTAGNGAQVLPLS